MHRWTTLEPVKLYGIKQELKKPSATEVKRPHVPLQQYIGPLPADIHVLIIQHLPIPAIPKYALASRALSRLSHDERIWKRCSKLLNLEDPSVSSLLALIDPSIANGDLSFTAAVLDVHNDDEDFGDFASASPTFDPNRLSSSITSSAVMVGDTLRSVSRTNYKNAHVTLMKLCSRLRASASMPPHLILSELFVSPANDQLNLRQQSKTLRLLSCFLSPVLQPTSEWRSLRATLVAVIDRFQANALATFESADVRGDEARMTEAAWASWECWERPDVSPNPIGNDWEPGKVWADKIETFYEAGRWDPLQNFTPEGRLACEAMDSFMSHVLEALKKHGSRAIRVFPKEAGVLLSFADRLATDVIGEYITPLLTHARSLPNNESFLQAVAASFAQSWRLVTGLINASEVSGVPERTSTAKGGPHIDAVVTTFQAEDVIFRMFEPNMDEYLDEEVEQVKRILENICSAWDVKCNTAQNLSDGLPNHTTAQFLTSASPAQVKRTVLASFTDLMVVPVTIVPRAVGDIVQQTSDGIIGVGSMMKTGGAAAVSGIAMLNPARWAAGVGASAQGYGMTRVSLDADDNQNVLFEHPEEQADDFVIGGKSDDAPGTFSYPAADEKMERAGNVAQPSSDLEQAGLSEAESFESLQLMLSLDVALEIIHADRESLKRVESFSAYPGHYGHRVRDTIEEIFIIMLQVLADRHIIPGFQRATEQIRTHDPVNSEDTEHMAPLMQFLELVHVGDMIQSMVQVYFEKELSHIDRTDFLNGVVREKKRFENALDECVAAGLNAGTDLLMVQVEHIIQRRTGPREYYPPDGAIIDLKPTMGCREAIASLETHCRLVKGGTSKEVLEVFHQEIGLRLSAIIQKHLKRQIISLEGGFQVIADLNAYHTFVASLRVPTIAAEFANLKMLGHVYIVEDAKDLAQIVRDVTRYGGSFRPEDVYEFIQRRSDWKKIEKTVDKAMYNLNFKEDCVIM